MTFGTRKPQEAGGAEQDFGIDPRCQYHPQTSPDIAKSPQLLPLQPP